VVFAGLRDLRSAADAAPSSTDAFCVDICESLLIESARRGLIDLRSVRLPGTHGAPALVRNPAGAAEALLQAHEWPGTDAPVRILQLDDGGKLGPVGA
jgi:hypothetical protein